jgi:hypothetical protein
LLYTVSHVRTATYRERVPGCRLEDLPNPLTGLGTALDVALRTDLLRHRQTLSPLHWSLVHPLQVLLGLAILTKILLARDKDNRETLAEVEDFRNPLDVSHVS